MPLPEYTDRTKLRIINSLRWRIIEARNIGHQVEECEGDLTEFIDAFCGPMHETPIDRRRALRCLKAIGRIQ